MNNERLAELSEKYISASLNSEEAEEFQDYLNQHPEAKIAINEHIKLKELMMYSKLKEPKVEFWDIYKEKLFNRIERNTAWFLIILGSIVVGIFFFFNLVDAWFSEHDLPDLVKYGIASLMLGFILLIFSLIRERIQTFKNDKYKEVER
ncbi:MAG: hypothetical protein K9I71_00170 [Ignavibacteriales bacterium]|nr:hypothetical protein [Ignavibacteriales bacterium]MCF8314505.1 hypothetical protein [Ignavibacteriales bacterium]MCF8436458.1 hypothetical protein [Ignavibacteriales bacterium]